MCFEEELLNVVKLDIYMFNIYSIVNFKFKVKG